MIDLGVVRPGATIRIPFTTFKGSDGSALTMTNFTVADILIYKDGNTTERASTSGFTASTDFDAKTGKHLVTIDLADNTTAGFYAAGSEYLVAVDAVTVDGVTTGLWIGRFTIGYEAALLNTTIATLTSQTSFTLTAGPSEDDAITEMWVLIHDVASAHQCAKAFISDYVGATKTVTLASAPSFTIAAGDNVSIRNPDRTYPSNFSSLLISASGKVTVGTNDDKTGYTLSQAFPTNFSSMVISGAGIVSCSVTDKTGFSLTAGERTAIANEVEVQIIDETDSEKVLTAITDKIAAVNPSLSGLTLAAIASAVRTNLATELGRIDVATSTRATQISVDDIPTSAELTLALDDVTDTVLLAITGLNDLSQAQVQTAAAAALTAYGPAIAGDAMSLTSAERTTLVGNVWAYVTEGAITAVQVLRAVTAFVMGRTTGGGTTTPVFRDQANTKNRITMTVDSNGNRTSTGGDLT